MYQETQNDPYPQGQQEEKKIRLSDYDLKIRFLSYGCVVSIGCKEIAFSSIDDAMSEINFYVKNPEEAENNWRKKFTN